MIKQNPSNEQRIPNTEYRTPRLSIIWLFGFIAIALLAYWRTRSAGFVTDWLGWEYRYRAGGWSDILSSFGYKGMHPVLHFFNYSLYQLFGKSAVWYTVFAFVHGLNAWLVGSLYLRLAPERFLQRGALGVSLLFLFSPYAAEPMVWRVCLHYLLVLAFSLLALHSTLDYLQLRDKKAVYWVHIFFLLGLFSLEWTLVLPGLVAILLFWWQLQQHTWNWRPWVMLVGVQAVLLASWFGLNQLVIGQAVGHYGAEKHLKFIPVEVLANTWKYLLKNLFFMRYWHHPLKEKAFGWMDHPIFAYGLLLALLFAIGLGIKHALAKKTTLLTITLLLASFAVATLPVSNLYFYLIDYSENDRYGYFALPFFWMAVMLALTRLPLFLARLLVIGAIIVSVYSLNKTTLLWHESDQQYRSLVHDFHQYDRDQILLLAIPDNYHGVYMFRMIGGESGFKEALELYTNKPFKGKMAEAVMYNAQSLTDATKVTVDSTGTMYHVSFVHDGSWWWWNGIGASDRETEWFTYTKKEWHSEVKLKELRPNSAILYPVQGKWVEVK
jgi:hypothetical protein